MNFNDFITDIHDKLYKEYQLTFEKQLLQDIIMIYNECYLTYKDYVKTMKDGNIRIDEFSLNKQTFSIHPKHLILEEELYNFICSLRLLYKNKKIAFDKIQTIMDTWATIGVMSDDEALRQIDDVITEVLNNDK